MGTASLGTRLALGLFALALAAAAARTGVCADDGKPVHETKTFEGRSFGLVLPPSEPADGKRSLLLVIGSGTDDPSGQFADLARDGYVVVGPTSTKTGGAGWATSEAEELLGLVSHLVEEHRVDPDRVHALSYGDGYGFSTFVVYGKDPVFASFTLPGTDLKGKSPPKWAKKRLAVLGVSVPEGKESELHKKCDGKVRHVETLPSGPEGPYFAYFLDVMGGRFRAGHDLSFDWMVDEPASGANAEPTDALTLARAQGRRESRAVWVYFWSGAEAESAATRALQNEVFFDPDVRRLGRRMIAVKLERARHAEQFTALGLTSTPAVVILDGSDPEKLAVAARCESKITAKELAKEFEKAK